MAQSAKKEAEQQTITASNEKQVLKGTKSAKDYVIDYFVNGHDTLVAAVQAGDITKSKAKQVVAILKAQGRDTSILETTFARGLHYGAGRGRPAPTVGERRDYRAQQIHDDSVFGRIPLTTLGIKKAGRISVAFEADRIIITKK